MPRPLIIYVPGLLPKPEPELHHEALQRCLLAGLSRADAEVAESLSADPACFDLISWTYDFYKEHRDISLDRAAIEAVISQPEASTRDITEAASVTRHLTRWIYHLGDMLPFLIPHLASEKTEVHMRDLRRYVRNENGIGDHVRRMLKVRLRSASRGQHPVLLIGHSMGSVICYDALWELTHETGDSCNIDLFMTMGSPLGQRYIQRRILGYDETGAKRYPGNIHRWVNLSAVGDLTAIDPYLAKDFAEMHDLQLVESIEDDDMFNYYRLDGVLNVHSEYGYLVNEKTALTIAAWWRGRDSDFS